MEPSVGRRRHDGGGAGRRSSMAPENKVDKRSGRLETDAAFSRQPEGGSVGTRSEWTMAGEVGWAPGGLARVELEAGVLVRRGDVRTGGIPALCDAAPSSASGGFAAGRATDLTGRRGHPRFQAP